MADENPYLTAETRKVKKSVNAFGARHPLNNQANAEKLLAHIHDRLQLAKKTTDKMTERYADIDRQLSGYVKLDDEDKKRDAANKRGEVPAPVKVNLQLAQAQLDGLVTYYASVFSPDSGMFESVSDKDKQPVTNGLTVLMNKHAEAAGYYQQYCAYFYNAFKYNLAAMSVEWQERLGSRLTRDAMQGTRVNKEVVWSGNVIKAMDMYNTLWDPSVHPVQIPWAGEFVAEVSMITEFTLRKRQADGEYYNTHLLKRNQSLHNAYSYYTAPPDLRSGAATSSTNWVSILSAGHATHHQGYELIVYTGWLNPKLFGLSDVDDLQIWRIWIINGGAIVNAKELVNAHGMLPVVFCSPIVDDTGTDQLSIAEQLIPLQTFGSFLLNTHQYAMRKSLWGTTIYDGSVVNLNKVPAGDVAARIACEPTGHGKDLRNSVVKFNDVPNTDATMANLAQVIELMERVIPTNILKQVADLQRATQYQAAATVQGGNRRSHKGAKLIDDQSLKHLRFMMFYNIWQFQDVVEVVDQYSGQVIEINPAQLKDTDVEFAIADGLKGIDRMLVIDQFREIIHMVLQSPQASQEIDVVSLLNYFTALLGDRVNLTQFRRTPQEQVGQAVTQDPMAAAQAMAQLQGGGNVPMV